MPLNEEAAPSAAKPPSAAPDLIAALLWIAARGEAPTMADVHHWANWPDPAHVVGPIVAALRYHTDPHVAWDARIVERDLQQTKDRQFEVAAFVCHEHVVGPV